MLMFSLFHGERRGALSHIPTLPRITGANEWALMWKKSQRRIVVNSITLNIPTEYHPLRGVVKPVRPSSGIKDSKT